MVTEELQARGTRATETNDADAMLHAMGTAVVALDRRGIVTYANAAAACLVGCDLDTMRGAPLAHSAPFVEAETRRPIDWGDEGAALEAATLALMRHDGSERLVVATETPHRDIIGTHRGVLITLHDVTRQRAVSELRQRSAALDAVSEVAGRVAHEVCDLGLVTLGHTELLDECLPVDSPARASLTPLVRVARRADDLGRQLSALTRRRATRVAEVDLARFVEELLPLFGRLVGDAVGLEVRTTADAWTVQIDALDLQQVLIQLVARASEGMASGHVTVAADNRRLSRFAPEVMAGVLRPGDHVALTVARPAAAPATGGAPTAAAPSFDALHGLVRLVGGHLRETEDGFLLILPASHERHLSTVPPSPSSRPPVEGKATILVVEENELARAVVVGALRRSDYDVVAAVDAPDAVARALRHPRPTDLLVANVVVGGAHGRDLAARLREALGDEAPTRVLYLSGFARSADDRPVLLDHRIDLLTKPFRPRELLQRVERALQ